MRFIINLLKKWWSNHLKWRFRRTVIKQAAEVGKGLKVNASSFVSQTTKLGNNVNFNGMIISGGGIVRIGDNFHSGSDCLIYSQNHEYDFGTEIPYSKNKYLFKDVTISDNVWFGSKVIILPGVKIGEGAIIQAGAVVGKNVPDFGIAGGNPAVVFKYRDKEHYLEMKAQGKFW
jgi:chloramphenicol O-acetyltransferase type B